MSGKFSRILRNIIVFIGKFQKNTKETREILRKFKKNFKQILEKYSITLFTYDF